MKPKLQILRKNWGAHKRSFLFLKIQNVINASSKPSQIFHVFSFQKPSQIFYVFSFQKSVEKSALPCYNIPIYLGLAHASRWMNFKSWSSLAAMTRDCKSLGLHLRRFESYLQHQSCLCMTRRLSSVVEHFHGKEGVSSSNLEGGSMRRK